MRLLPLLTTLVLTGMLAACGADTKGNWCGILDMGFSGDEKYCPEADAPERCEEIRDLLIDHIEECGEGAGVTFTPEQLEEVASQLDCEDARAIRASEEDCRESIPEEPCGETGVPELPDACEGVILNW